MATIENDNIEIEYYVRHEKGYANVPPIEWVDVKRVSVYVRAIDDWVDVTELASEQLDNKVNKLIEKDRAESRDKSRDI